MPWKLGTGPHEVNRSVKSPRNVLLPLFVIKGRPGTRRELGQCTVTTRFLVDWGIGWRID